MRIRELLIVEGKYDAAKLSGLVDGLILTTGGFSIYRDREKRELIKEMDIFIEINIRLGFLFFRFPCMF